MSFLPFDPGFMAPVLGTRPAEVKLFVFCFLFSDMIAAMFCVIRVIRVDVASGSVEL